MQLKHRAHERGDTEPGIHLRHRRPFWTKEDRHNQRRDERESEEERPQR